MKYLRWSIMAVVGLAFVGYDRTPLPWPDEVFYVEPARELAQTGHLAAPMFGPVRRLDEDFLLQPPVAVVERAALFSVFGFGHSVNRLAGIGEFLIGIFLMTRLVRAPACVGAGEWARGAGLLMVLLFAADPGLQEAFHSGRPDFVAIDLVLLSLFLCLRIDDLAGSKAAQKTYLFLIGLTGVAAATSHLAAAPYSAAGLFFVATAAALSEIKICGRLFYWVLGAVVPLGLWVFCVGWDMSIWRVQVLSHILGTAAGQGAGNSLSWVRAIANPLSHLITYFRPSPAAVVLFAGCAWIALRNRAQSSLSFRGPRQIAVFICFGLAASFVAENFVKFLAPLFFVWCASFLASEKVRSIFIQRRTLAVSLIAALVAIAVAVPTARAATVVAQWDARSPEPVAKLVRDNVPAGEPILGTAQGYFAAQANGNRFIYAVPLDGVRVLVSPDDIRQHHDYVLKVRPKFAMLDAKDDPRRVLEFMTNTNFVELGSVRSGSLLAFRFIRRAGYDLRLWRIDYMGDPAVAGPVGVGVPR